MFPLESLPIPPSVKPSVAGPAGLECPFCAYDFAGFPGGDPPVCPECGQDPAAERRAVIRWHRGAQRWVWGAVIVIVCCAIATLLSGNGRGIAIALLIEALVGGIGVAMAVGWSLSPREPNVRPAALIRNAGAARAIVPIAMVPVIVAAIWSWYVPLFQAHPHPDGFDDAGVICSRLTNYALLASVLVWTFAVISTLRRIRSLGQFARYLLSLLLVTIASAVLSFFAMMAALFLLVGGDGRGP
ncbi:MAG: hypothetical protein QM783_11345 [Phycisphaerales bacterium]